MKVGMPATLSSRRAACPPHVFANSVRLGTDADTPKLHQDNDLSDAKKKKRREIKLLSNESVWLQKALFALQKAETAREKLADHRGEEDVPFEVPRDGSTLELEDVLEAMENRIRHLLDTTQEARRAMR